MADVDRLTLVDAHDGTVALSFSQVHAADSRICDNAGVVRSSHARAACPSTWQTVTRSDATGPSAVTEVERAYQLSEATLAFYAALGRDSIDGAGMPVVSTVRFCLTTSCPYSNAYWNGAQMVYGTGFGQVDDVVAHELTHGVTQYESRLFYYGESGALNESLSDVFGELFDQWYDSSWDVDGPAAAWLIGEDLPVGAIRDMSDPTAFGHPDRMTSPFYWADPADHYGVHMNSGVNNKAAFLIADGGSFNGQTVTGLGLWKTAAIYLEVQTSLLTAGSDHLDLARALPQACTNLVGSFGITSADCTSVSKAVAATEMHLAPVVPGARLTAPDCPDGHEVAEVVVRDDMESATGWTTTSTTEAGRWFFTDQSSQSGTRSLYAPDPSVLSIASATRTGTWLVPSTGPFLRFDHSHSFDASTDSTSQYWDGGTVQLSVDGGAWTDVAALALPAVHGYNGVLAPDNALGTRQAFVGDSPGYQRTRYDLSSLAGREVALRFTVSTDSVVGGNGWAIDDVEVYRCAAPAPPPSPEPSVPPAAPPAEPPSGGGTAAPAAEDPPPTPEPAPEPAPVPVPEPAPTTESSSPSFSAVRPARVLDTRGESPGAMRPVPVARVQPGSPLVVDMSALPGGATPATGLAAVALNVVATDAAAAGYVTVYPCGEQPVVSSVNFVSGDVVANAVMAPVSTAGLVCFAASTPVHLVVDLNGWFRGDGGFRTVGPARVLDTRGQSPGALLAPPPQPLTPDAALVVPVAGLPGGFTPSSGLGAVSLNVTVTGPSSAGFVTVYPCGDRPLVSSVNFTAGQTVSNAVIAPVSSDGRICVFSSTSTDVVIDLNGWVGEGSSFQAAGPGRVFDTRGDSPAALRPLPAAQVSPGAPLTVRLTALPGITPDGGVAAIALNLTVTGSARAGYVTVHPCGEPPATSSLNFGPGETVSNAVIATVSAEGNVCILASSPVDVVVDAFGWFPTSTSG